jgi:hypothetical protein
MLTALGFFFQREYPGNFAGDGQGPSRSCIDKYPVRLAPHQNLAVGLADEFVLSQGPDAPDIFHPCPDLDLFSGKRGEKVFDPVLADKPGRLLSLRFDAADGGVMLDGDPLSACIHWT